MSDKLIDPLIENPEKTETTPAVEAEVDVDDSQFIVDEEQDGLRIDKVLGERISHASRSAIQQWIKTEKVLVNGKKVKQTYKLQFEDHVTIEFPEIELEEEFLAEDLPINVVYEDDDIIVINKPAGLVVHPGAGNTSGTLMNGVAFRWPESTALPRAGIVHRLDKDTSGLMVLAKNEHARLHLIEQLSERTLSREYLAITLGALISGSTISQRIRRDTHDRRKMRICKDHEQGGKDAITHFRIEQRFRKHTLVRVKLETGRTHQIRVHMTSIGYPLVGDPVYGKRLVLPKGADEGLVDLLRSFKRQALHATRLKLEHPVTGEMIGWEAELPEDMQTIIDGLQLDTEQHED